ISEYEKLIDKDPNNPALHFSIGVIYMKKCLYNMAVNEYRIALRIQPDYLFAIENLALIYPKGGLTTVETINLWEKALTLEKRPEWRVIITKHLKKLKY
ncbi:MAG: hypothetical protein ABIH68_04020, partial [bacterium]